LVEPVEHPTTRAEAKAFTHPAASFVAIRDEVFLIPLHARRPSKGDAQITTTIGIRKAGRRTRVVPNSTAMRQRLRHFWIDTTGKPCEGCTGLDANLTTSSKSVNCPAGLRIWQGSFFAFFIHTGPSQPVYPTNQSRTVRYNTMTSQCHVRPTGGRLRSLRRQGGRTIAYK